jgi:hypothetical protein
LKPIRNEKGAVLVVAIIIIGLLTVLGTVTTMTTSIELNIARNEKVGKTAFYRAENSRVIAASAVQSAAWGTDYADGDKFEDNDDIIIRDGDFIMEGIGDSDTTSASPDVEMTGSLSAIVDVDKVSTEPLPGGSAEFGSGYEGTGKSGAVQSIYLIDSIGSGPGSAMARLLVEYRLIPQ